MRRVVINKRHWAVGLQWFMGTAKQTAPDLRRAAGKLDHSLDMVAYRQRQYGFAASGGVVRDWLGVRALAAAVRVTSPSFLGLFCLADKDGEFWWVFAISQSLIVGMGDQVFPNRPEAEEWIQSLKGLLDSDFAETATCATLDESLLWLTPLISAGPFSRLRSRNGYLQPLQPIPGQRRKLAALGSLAAVLLLGGYGVRLFLAHQAGKKAMEATRVAMVNKEQRKQELLAHPERHFPQPWTTAPEMHEFVSRGIKALLTLPIAASGWVLERAVFDGEAVTVTWGHKPGADYVHLPLSARIETPQKAISRLPIPKRRGQRTPSPLLSQEQCTRLL
ncbi:type 4b pilus protein PilO2, partial [Desulfovibrio sp. DV]|uniref:type 4b pilus protein PilO2 n=1 Tax=Desulfovibrio sp. DV TaxID=1844708 RepID=UPI00094B7939